MVKLCEGYGNKTEIVWMRGKDCVKFEERKYLPILNLLSRSFP